MTLLGQQWFAPRTVLPVGSGASPGRITAPFEHLRLPRIVFPFSSSVVALSKTDPPTVLASTSKSAEELLRESVPPIVLPGQPPNPSGSPIQKWWTVVTRSRARFPLMLLPQMVGLLV